MKYISNSISVIKNSLLLTMIFSASLFTLFGVLINVFNLNDILFFHSSTIDNVIFGAVLGIINYEVRKAKLKNKKTN